MYVSSNLRRDGLPSQRRSAVLRPVSHRRADRIGRLSVLNGSSSTETRSTELRQLLASIATDLEERPGRALGRAFRSAIWILRQLYVKHLSEWPGELDYNTLLEHLAPYLPKRIAVQFRAVEHFAAFAEDPASEETEPPDDDDQAITPADVLPCLQALDNLVQWYQKDVLSSGRPFAFLPEPSSTSNEAMAPEPAGLDDTHTEVMASHTTSTTATTIHGPSRLTPRMRRILAFAAPLLIIAFFCIQLFETKTAADKRLGLTTDADNPRVVVTSVTPGGPMDRSGILPDDVLLQMGQYSLVTRRDYLRALRTLERGRMVTLRVERDGLTRRFEVVPGVPIDWQDVMIRGFVVLCCLILGNLTFIRRSGGLRGQLLSLFLWLIAAEMALPQGGIQIAWVGVLSALLYYVLTGAQMSAHFHIASVIPERQPWIARRPWLIHLFYAAGLGFGLIGCATLLLEGVWQLDGLPWRIQHIDGLVNLVLLPIWAIGVLVLLTRSALGHPDREGRFQAWIILGGVLPWSLYVAITTYFSFIGQTSPDWTGSLFPAIALCFPAAIWGVMEQESRHQERILVGLMQRIREVGSIDELLELIGNSLDRAFHPTVVHVFFQRRTQQELTLRHSTGAPAATGRVPTDFELLKHMAKLKRVQSLEDDLAMRLPGDEIDWLKRLYGHLIIPVRSGADELVGLIVLGHKRSEEAYSTQEKKQLVSVADQIALAFENMGLHSELDERQRIEREVLARLGDRQINLVKECEICRRCYDHDKELCEFDHAELVLSVPVERTIGERYRLERLIGKGGIGSVYAASDLRLNRDVAVKVLLGSVIDNPMIKKRFEQEARIVAQLSHPNIVTLYDCGQTALGNAFIVLELLEGFTLREALRRHGRIPHKTLAEWFDQVLYGLVAAHAEGIVHRDLKPGNVLITDTGRKSSVKLLDFGVAKIKSNPLRKQGLTVPGVVLGTHGYMAPEQLMGDEVDERADLYSVGVMLLEALTGQHPIAPKGSRSEKRTVRVSLGNSPQAQALERVIQRCLNKDPVKRYPSADALRRALLPVLKSFPGVGSQGLRQETETIGAPQGTEKIEITGALEETIKELRREMRKRRQKT